VCAPERLLREVAVNVTLAHNDGSLRTTRWRAEVNKRQGVDSPVRYDAGLSPIMGFKAGPAAGEAMAELIAIGKTPELIARVRPGALPRRAPRRRAGRRGGGA
jgi:hypothetical protein